MTIIGVTGICEQVEYTGLVEDVTVSGIKPRNYDIYSQYYVQGRGTLGLWVRMPPEVKVFVTCKCRVF